MKVEKTLGEHLLEATGKLNSHYELKEYLTKENSELLNDFKWGSKGSNEFHKFMKLVRDLVK